MPRDKMLKDDILQYLKEKGNPVTFHSLYDEFKSHSKSGIRVTVYRLVRNGLVAKASDKRPVSYKAK
jgi:Fe2+ or Zn2+ uptake regulation protein